MNREILRLALPAIISNITVPLLGLVDLTIVGHMGDTATGSAKVPDGGLYIGAIAVGTMIFNVIYWVFAFLRMGTSGMTSQAYGRCDSAEIIKLYRRTLTIGVGMGLLFIILQWPLREVALWMMQTEASARPLVSTYYNICIWGAPASLGLFGLTGWLIGMQTTKIPMVVAILQNIVNIILSLIFVYALGMKIEGVAFGTMLSQWFAFLLSLLLSFRKAKDYLQHADEETNVFTTSLKTFAKVNRDIFFRTICLVAVNLYFTSAGSAQGSLLLAANTLLMTLFTIFSYFMDGFAFAGEAMSGKFWGQKDTASLSQLIKYLLLWGVGIALVFTAIYGLGGKAFLSLLTDDMAVIDCTSDFLPFAVAVPLMSFVAFVFDGIFIGLTRTRQMLLSCGTAAVVFFVLWFCLSPTLSNAALWISYLAFLLTRGLVLTFSKPSIALR